MARLLKQPILTPIEGLDYSKPSTMVNYRNGFPINVRISKGEIRKVEGYSLLGSSAIAGPPIMHMAEYLLNSLTHRIVRFSKTSAEKYNTNTSAWDDITHANPWTGDEGDTYSTSIAEDKLIVANYLDTTRVYNDAGVFTDLTDAPKAKAVMYLSPYLVCGYISPDLPSKVQWSDTGDITDWATGNASSALLNIEPSEVQALVNLDEFGIAYKKKSIYIGRMVDTSDVIKWDPVQTGVGLIAPRAVVSYQGNHWFMGDRNFYQFNGVRVEPIAHKINEFMFSQLQGDKLGRSWALLRDDLDEVWFFVITAGNSYPNQCWKYNYKYTFWYMDEVTNLTGGATFQMSTTKAWDDMVGTWDQSTITWNDTATTADSPFYVLGDSTGYTYRTDPNLNNRNSVAISSSWQSMDFVAETFENFKRWQMMNFWAKGNEITVSYSKDFGATWSSIKTVTLSGDWTQYRIYFDVVAASIRFKFENNNAGETFTLRQFTPYFLEREFAP